MAGKSGLNPSRDKAPLFISSCRPRAKRCWPHEGGAFGRMDRARRRLRLVGFPSGAPRLLLAIDEADLNTGIGVGLAVDALRRALLARGVEAGDARDPLNREKFTPRDLADALRLAKGGGAEFLLLGRV